MTLIQNLTDSIRQLSCHLGITLTLIAIQECWHIQELYKSPGITPVCSRTYSNIVLVVQLQTTIVSFVFLVPSRI